MSIYISHLYVELDINVIIVSFDVIFIEKLLIGKSVDFLGIFIFIQEENGLDLELDLGCVMGESVDFSRVLRYWVRYLDFVGEWLKSGDFIGFGGILSQGL